MQKILVHVDKTLLLTICKDALKSRVRTLMVIVKMKTDTSQTKNSNG